MTDNRMNRVKVMLGGPQHEGDTSEHALLGHPGFPNQALQVLTMAQRTAEEHVATAHQQADKIRTDALAAAEQIAREAEQHAHNVRREADKVLYDARAGAERMARDAQAHGAEAQRNVEKIVADARAQAGTIVSDAQDNADELQLQAQRRYDDVVGSLGVKREALQQQIEALEQFDREYRARLSSFMQGQLRALWVDQPQVTGELPHAEPEPVHEAAPVEQDERDEYDERDEGAQRAQRDGQVAIPLQRQGSPIEPQPVGAHASDDE